MVLVVLEGSLSRFWVAELESACRRGDINQQPERIRVNLSEVTFVSDEGKQLLERICSAGIRSYEDLSPVRREPLKVSVPDTVANAITALGEPPIVALGTGKRVRRSGRTMHPDWRWESQRRLCSAVQHSGRAVHRFHGQLSCRDQDGSRNSPETTAGLGLPIF